MSVAMKPSEVLRKARGFIADEGAWTKGENARSRRGDRVSPTSPLAVCFCSEGALIKATSKYNLDAPENKEAVMYLKMQIASSIFGWNDRETTSHADVLVAFDAAADLAEAEGR